MKDWASELDAITEQFLTSFGGYSSEQLNWKPNYQTWSIAQNIDHLIAVNESYYPVLVSLNEGTHKTPFIAKFGFMVSFLGKTILKAVNEDRKKKMKTFPIWEPTAGDLDGGILQRLEKHQTQLKRHMEASLDLINKGVVISSPANKNIVYTLEAAFDIIVSHERRHLEQAKQVVKDMKK